ncbi:hypothetical protein DAEQUDRAFT_598967 [Daedalea quercina L-15889]|uniref:Uncharacterized protein n=1 Tax=Daedalea quercina L-15889 TaxID=1314783 RepID=A0A165LPR7_9APHY|nr:hypothetical protein DAEQUDRAFT_598967 [Daedalea quercina L-15889]
MRHSRSLLHTWVQLAPPHRKCISVTMPPSTYATYSNYKPSNRILPVTSEIGLAEVVTLSLPL